MFPHATCLCVKTKTKIEQNVESEAYQIHGQHPYLYQKLVKGNSWIVLQKIDSVKICVLSLSKTSCLPFQQSSQHHSHDKQVSNMQIKIGHLSRILHHRCINRYYFVAIQSE